MLHYWRPFRCLGFTHSAGRRSCRSQYSMAFAILHIQSLNHPTPTELFIDSHKTASRCSAAGRTWRPRRCCSASGPPTGAGRSWWERAERALRCVRGPGGRRGEIGGRRGRGGEKGERVRALRRVTRARSGRRVECWHVRSQRLFTALALSPRSCACSCARSWRSF